MERSVKEEEENASSAGNITTPIKQKAKKKGVRFAFDDGDVIRPDKSPESLERSSSGGQRNKAADALDYLLAGNARFREGKLVRCKGGPEVIAETAEDDAKPSAIFLACSDSRVPPEIICDMGPGDSHVVRVGGNVVNEFVLGSIIFALQHLGCHLVVVLGHSRCTVVASAVQNWARSKSEIGDQRSARLLAHSVQETLGRSQSTGSLHNEELRPTNPPSPRQTAIQASQEKEHASAPPSPFHEHAHEHYSTGADKTPATNHQSQPSFFANCCACFSKSPTTEGSTQNGIPAQRNSPSSRSQRESLDGSGRKRSNSNEKGGTRNFVRQSINPLQSLVGAISGVVESVASSGQHDGLKHIVKKESEEDRGYDSDDADLKRGLQKMDSIDFTRARLAKSKQQRRIEYLRQMAERPDVDSIIDENAKVSATTIMNRIAKNLDMEILKEVEVVAAKYAIEDGSLKILSKNWYSEQSGIVMTT